MFLKSSCILFQFSWRSWFRAINICGSGDLNGVDILQLWFIPNHVRQFTVDVYFVHKTCRCNHCLFWMCKIHSTLQPSNHNWKNIRLHVQTKEYNTLSHTTAQFTTEKIVWINASLNTSSRSQKVCTINSANPGLPDRNNKGVNYTQPWNSVAHNCKSSLWKCHFKYTSSLVHTYGAHHLTTNYIIIFIALLWLYLDCVNTNR